MGRERCEIREAKWHYEARLVVPRPAASAMEGNNETQVTQRTAQRVRRATCLSVSGSASGWAHSSQVAAFLTTRLDIPSSRAAAGQ